MFKRILYLANVFGFPMWCTFFKFSNVSVRIIIKHQYPYKNVWKWDFAVMHLDTCWLKCELCIQVDIWMWPAYSHTIKINQINNIHCHCNFISHVSVSLGGPMHSEINQLKYKWYCLLSQNRNWAEGQNIRRVKIIS